MIQKIGKNNFNINFIRNTIEKYIRFPVQQPKKGIKPGLPLVIMDSTHFLNKPLDNLVTYVAKNDCYNLNQEFSANVLDFT